MYGLSVVVWLLRRELALLLRPCSGVRCGRWLWWVGLRGGEATRDGGDLASWNVTVVCHRKGRRMASGSLKGSKYRISQQ